MILDSSLMEKMLIPPCDVSLALPYYSCMWMWIMLDFVCIVVCESCVSLSILYVSQVLDVHHRALCVFGCVYLVNVCMCMCVRVRVQLCTCKTQVRFKYEYLIVSTLRIRRNRISGTVSFHRLAPF